jgi:uncharacterized protein (DUF885 family)
LDPPRSALEADRYVAMPGQALAYKIGQLEIEACRRQAEREEADFSLRDFHDQVLALGSVPLVTFRREMRGAGPDDDTMTSKRRGTQ